MQSNPDQAAIVSDADKVTNILRAEPFLIPLWKEAVRLAAIALGDTVEHKAFVKALWIASGYINSPVFWERASRAAALNIESQKGLPQHQAWRGREPCRCDIPVIDECGLCFECDGAAQ